ncbi:molybdopterin converting factor subunit 1 [Planctobacterium marinum]|uniref:molybdopterin converting factor subunit 1 n=1 Tax=Planctobacterium marinum TaxID=1631968 RepID=UPI001E3CF75D|nr:molybdopterin converting factor subunit 1 [Planctobacterium marinum]MCC2603884.1 molybdopterin converting factor subunit 1 [Planctobacterium marinum]
MITVLFFAQLREQLQCDKLQLDDYPQTVAELRAMLGKKSPLWSELLVSDTALAAVNQTISHDQVSLNSGDEVAFFPPVTGG